ncbi:MAG: hypothetical protein HC869_03985 [Rhodospirillales bacterium]|nr:hypothetical protein [Rhodospirillales bacterium]
MGNTLRGWLGVAGVVLGLAVGVASAQDVVRLRGTIEHVENGAYVVKARDGSTVWVALAANAGVAASVKDIAPPQ